MRSRYMPSLPGEPCATTAMSCNAGFTGVAGSARSHSRTASSSLPSICSVGYSPNTPMCFESGLP